VPDLEEPHHPIPPWTHQQILLHYLKAGMPYDDALAALDAFQENLRMNEMNGYSYLNAFYRSVPSPKSNASSGGFVSCPEQLYLRGE
jgi:hypothetical protein